MEFKWSHFAKEIILWGIRWYVAYPISYRQVEEMMQECGVTVAHSPRNRWVIRMLQRLKNPSAGGSGRSGRAGGGMSPLSVSRAKGNMCLARSTERGKPSTFC